LEVHNPAAFENAFRCRTVTLTAAPIFIEHVKSLGLGGLSVVSPDTGGAKRAELFREALEETLKLPVGKPLRTSTAALALSRANFSLET